MEIGQVGRRREDQLERKARALGALRLEATDRVPVVGGFVRHAEFLAEVAGVSLEAFWAAPRERAVEAFRVLGADLILGLILPNRKSAIGAPGPHTQSHAFRSPEEVRDHVLAQPGPEQVREEFDAEAVREDYRRRMTEGQELCGEMLWVPSGIHSQCVAFEHGTWLGYEGYLMALSLYPEAMERLYAADGERAYLTNRVVAEVTREEGLTPVVWTGTDICDNRGPVVRPEILERIYFPHLRRALAPLVEAGITIVWHADGYITPLVGELLRAGVDGFQGLQERVGRPVEVEALRERKTQAGRPPVIVGSVSSTVTMPFGSAEEVRAEVRRWQCFSRERGGGVLLNFSSSLGPEVPKANLYAFYEAAAAES